MNETFTSVFCFFHIACVIGSSKFSLCMYCFCYLFKVLRDGGFWQKMNVRQPEYRLKGRHGGGSPHEFLRSPWIKHYKSLPKTQVVSSKALVICSSGSASNLKNMLREGCSHLHDRDQISIGEEEGISFFFRALQIYCVIVDLYNHLFPI